MLLSNKSNTSNTFLLIVENVWKIRSFDIDDIINLSFFRFFSYSTSLFEHQFPVEGWTGSGVAERYHDDRNAHVYVPLDEPEQHDDDPTAEATGRDGHQEQGYDGGGHAGQHHGPLVATVRIHAARERGPQRTEKVRARHSGLLWRRPVPTSVVRVRRSRHRCRCRVGVQRCHRVHEVQPDGVQERVPQEHHGQPAFGVVVEPLREDQCSKTTLTTTRWWSNGRTR